MYLDMEYRPCAPGGTPVGLSLKTIGREGPEYAYVTWNQSDMSDMAVIGEETRLLSGPVQVNGSCGLEPYVMHGSRLLNVYMPKSCSVNIRSIKFYRSVSTAGRFMPDGLPDTFTALAPDNDDICEYFNKKNLFNTGISSSHGLNRIAFDTDVRYEAVQDFMRSHPGASHGVFCDLMDLDNDNCVIQKTCFIWADDRDLAWRIERWKEQDLAQLG